MLVLVAESDPQLGQALTDGLEHWGLQVELVDGEQEVLRCAGGYEYSAVVLGAIHGCETVGLCQRMRVARVGSPIVVLVDQDDGVDGRVAALNSGADDCVTWPFSCRELAARIQAAQRRAAICERPMLSCGDLRLDALGHRVWRGDVAIELTRTEFALLKVLMAHPGTVISQHLLIERVWGDAAEDRSNLVPVYMGYLRKKIDRPFGRASLQTVRGVGYRLTSKGGAV